MSLQETIYYDIKQNMKKYVWSKYDGYGLIKPYAIIECSSETEKKIKHLKNNKTWEFIANKLHERYPDKFPTWLNCFGEKHIFWHNNIIETY
jgi:hypothetical protein